METTIFKAVEESIQEVVRRKGSSYWNNLNVARNLIGNSYTDEGLATQKATRLPFSQKDLRWAYVHLYLTPHVHMVEDILGHFWTSRKYFRVWYNKLAGGHVQVCCVGGGPGTDLLGLARFIRKHRLNLAGIQGHVLDQWTQWEETFCTLARHFDPQGLVLPAGGVGINYRELHFQQVLEGRTPTWTHLECLEDADLVTMVKFVSAVASDKEILLQMMKPGALLFFLDNAGGGYATIVRHAAATVGFCEIGKLEHKDIKLPDNEATAIASSKLRLPKIKSEKTWKVSAYLWKKGDNSNNSSGESSKKRSKKRKSKTATKQLSNPTLSQHSIQVHDKKPTLSQFWIMQQQQQLNKPQISNNPPVHSTTTQTNSGPKFPIAGYKIPKSLPFTQPSTSTLAQSHRTGYQSVTTSTYSATATASIPSPVCTTPRRSAKAQCYQSDYATEHQFDATTSYQNYNPTPLSRSGNTNPQSSNNTGYKIPQSLPSMQTQSSNLAKPYPTGYQSVTTTIYSTPATASIPRPVRTTQPKSVVTQSYQSNHTTEHRFAITTSYQNYNPDPSSTSSDINVHDPVNHTPNLVLNSSPVCPSTAVAQEEELGCCAAIVVALGRLCK